MELLKLRKNMTKRILFTTVKKRTDDEVQVTVIPSVEPKSDNKINFTTHSIQLPISLGEGVEMWGKESIKPKRIDLNNIKLDLLPEKLKTDLIDYANKINSQKHVKKS